MLSSGTIGRRLWLIEVTVTKSQVLVVMMADDEMTREVGRLPQWRKVGSFQIGWLSECLAGEVQGSGSSSASQTPVCSNMQDPLCWEFPPFNALDRRVVCRPWRIRVSGNLTARISSFQTVNNKVKILESNSNRSSP